MKYKRMTSKTSSLYNALGIEDRLYKRLQELEDKIENGLIFELPCKVNTVVYYINREPSISLKANTIYEAILHAYEMYRCNDNNYFVAVLQIHNDYGVTQTPLVEKFDETWFLTREQAEAKLKELRSKE